MGLQSGNVGNRICCGDKDAADTGRPKSCRGVPARQCAGAAAGTPLQHHTSVPHRGTCYFSATFVTIRDIFSLDVCGCWRDIPGGEQVRQTAAAGPGGFHQTIAASFKTDQIEAVMKSEVDVGDGCWWVFTFRPSSAVSPSAHRPPDQVHLTGSSLRDGASVSPGFCSVSAAASLSASRLKADTFYSTAAAAAAAYAQTQSRTALHLRVNRLFTAELRAARPRPRRDQTTPPFGR